MNEILNFLNNNLISFCDSSVGNVLKSFHLDDIDKDSIFLYIKHKDNLVYLAVSDPVIGRLIFNILKNSHNSDMMIHIHSDPNITDLKQANGVFTLVSPANCADEDSVLSNIYSGFFIRSLSNSISEDFSSLVYEHIHKFHFTHIGHTDRKPKYYLSIYNKDKYVMLYFANLEVCMSFIRIMDSIEPSKNAPTFYLYNKPNLVEGDDFLVISQKEFWQ